MADRKPVPLTADTLANDLEGVISFMRLYVHKFPGRLDDNTPDELEALSKSRMGLELLAKEFNAPAAPAR